MMVSVQGKFNGNAKALTDPPSKWTVPMSGLFTVMVRAKRV